MYTWTSLISELWRVQSVFWAWPLRTLSRRGRAQHFSVKQNTNPMNTFNERPLLGPQVLWNIGAFSSFKWDLCNAPSNISQETFCNESWINDSRVKTFLISSSSMKKFWEVQEAFSVESLFVSKEWKYLVSVECSAVSCHKEQMWIELQSPHWVYHNTLCWLSLSAPQCCWLWWCLQITTRYDCLASSTSCRQQRAGAWL